MKGIFHNDSLKDWLKRKDPTETYNYACSLSCGLSQYFREVTGQHISVDCWSVTINFDQFRVLPTGWDQAANGYPWTFGAMLDRLERIEKGEEFSRQEFEPVF